MRDFHGVIQALKIYIADGRDIKVLDKDVANILGLTQMQFATLKRRNSTPYPNVLALCKHENLCCNEIFFEETSLCER